MHDHQPSPPGRVNALRRPTGPGEASVALRAGVFAATLIAVLSVLGSGPGGPLHLIGAFIVLPLGTMISYRLRDARPPWLALLIGALLIGGLALFMVSVADHEATTSTQLQSPLVELLVWVAVVRSFDLRHRRDLLFALAGSGALMVVAAAVSTSGRFVLVLLPWMIVSLVSLAIAHRRDLAGDESPASLFVDCRAALPSSAGLFTLAAVLGTLIFLVVPAPRLSTAFLSSSLPTALAVGNPGGLSNSGEGKDKVDYPGFTERLDTNARPKLGNDIVMRVRASQPDFWRGQTFDRWDGRSWSLSEPKPFLLPTAEPARLPDLPGEDRVAGSPSFVQTYFIDRSGPNLVFAANRASAVYFPQTTLFELTDGTIRTGSEMVAGTSYTVVSERPLTTSVRLRRLGTLPETATSGAFRGRYTDLPDVPQRVRDLAETLTRGKGSTYEKVLALEAWIGSNTQYSLDIPVPAVGEDAVDQFLFEDKRGFCEQIASSLVVMLRSQGIPARLAAGYAPGQRNPLTSLYEVRSKDAHAWAEVYFPGVGWQGFDPTANVALAGEQPPQTAGSGLASYLARRLGSVPVFVWIALLASAATTTVGVRSVQRSRRHRAWAMRDWSTVMLARIDACGAALGRPRMPSDSAIAYVATLPDGMGEHTPLSRAASTIMRDAFAAGGASPADRADAEASISRLEHIAAGRAARRRHQRPAG